MSGDDLEEISAIISSVEEYYNDPHLMDIDQSILDHTERELMNHFRGESTWVDSRLELTGVDSVGGGDNSNEVEVEEEEEYDKAMETFSRTQSCWEIPHKQKQYVGRDS